MTRGMRAWGQLFRLPNLFTVPGDAAVGYVLAGELADGADFSLACLAVVLLYAGGVALNDYFDFDADRQERPERPLPSGAISRTAALVVGCLLLLFPAVLLGVFIAPVAGVAALVVAGFILVYDGPLRRRARWRMIAIMACRGGAVWIGAACASGALVPLSMLTWAAILLTMLYTLSIAIIAVDETQPSVGLNILPVAVVLVGMAILAATLPPLGMVSHTNPISLGLFLLAAAEAALWLFLGHRQVIPRPQLVGRLLLIMITIQAAWVVLGTEAMAGQVLAGAMLLRIASEVASRYFYMS